MKKLFFFLLVVLIILICGTVVFAGNDDEIYGVPSYSGTTSGIATGNNANKGLSQETGIGADYINEEGNINMAGGDVKKDEWKPVDPESPLGKIIKEKVDATEQFIVTVTKPVRGEIVFEPVNKYMITGESLETGIMVILAVYNNETGLFEEYRGIDGESSWEVGNSGLFEREFELKEGRNRLKLIAYRKLEIDNLVIGENLQVGYFTITLLKEDIKEELVTVKTDKTNITDNIFNLDISGNTK